MIYAVIDTNVLVAAAKTHKPDSSTSKVLSLVFAGIIQPLVCEEILQEYEEILNLPILNIPQSLANDILQQDVLKQRKRPLLGRPPLWYLLPLSRLNSING